jgi:hypothetical protein
VPPHAIRKNGQQRPFRFRMSKDADTILLLLPVTDMLGGAGFYYQSHIDIIWLRQRIGCAHETPRRRGGGPLRHSRLGLAAGAEDPFGGLHNDQNFVA